MEEWLTPAGQVIWHKGILPDVVVPLPPEVSPVFPEAEKGMTIIKYEVLLIYFSAVSVIYNLSL